MDWTTVAQDRVLSGCCVNMLMSFRVPEYWESSAFCNWTNVNFSRMTLLQRGRRERDGQSSEKQHESEPRFKQSSFGIGTDCAEINCSSQCQQCRGWHVCDWEQTDILARYGVRYFFNKKKNHVSFDFICIGFYNYNSVKFQDLLVVFCSNFYRKPAGSDVDWVLILNAGTSELKSSNYPSLHRACLLLHLLTRFSDLRVNWFPYSFLWCEQRCTVSYSQLCLFIFGSLICTFSNSGCAL